LPHEIIRLSIANNKQYAPRECMLCTLGSGWILRSQWG
jgi:hypothetical protein